MFLRQIWAEVMDIATCRSKNGSWPGLHSLFWSPQVFIWPPPTPHPRLFAGYLLTSSPLFKTDWSTSQETPPSSYVQEKRSGTQLSPTTTFLWTPSPPLATTPQTNEHPLNDKTGERKQRRKNLGRYALLRSHPLWGGKEEKKADKNKGSVALKWEKLSTTPPVSFPQINVSWWGENS